MFVAEKYCLIAGTGKEIDRLASFDKALQNAGVEDYNLVRVSSIIPPHCKRTNIIDSPKGAVLFIAYATLDTDTDEAISSAIAAAIPKNEDNAGVIMEYSCKENKEYAISYAERLAAEAMQRRNITEYQIISIGIETVGEAGTVTTVFSGIALM